MSKTLLVLNSIRGKSGKDTLIALLESQGFKVHRVAFADILKERCAAVLAHSSDSVPTIVQGMHSSSKDSAVQYLSISNIPDSLYLDWLQGPGRKDPVKHRWVTQERSLRWHLQQYGTGYCREFMNDPDKWLNLGLVEIQKGLDDPAVDIVVVSDCRLPNELDRLEAFKDSANVVTVRIVRDWFIPGVDDQTYHISDIALMARGFDKLVVNKLGEPWGMLDQLEGAY